MARWQWCGVWLIVAGSVTAGENWPQFRGPTGQGLADVLRVPVEWSETQNIAWKVALPGRGWSSPVVWGRQLWTTTATDEGHSLLALCVDIDTGSLVHEVEVFRIDEPREINRKNSHASPTPVVEEGRVYVHFGATGTACLTADTGEVLWTNCELELDHKEGPGSSPMLHGELLVVHCDGTDVQYVVALDKQTGEVVWKTTRAGELSESPDQRKAYSTPLAIDTPGGKQLICVGADWVFAYEPGSGQEIWRAHYTGFSNVPRPVFGHGLIYICTGYMRPELWAIDPRGRGDVSDSHVAWKHLQQVPANPSPLLVGDAIYMVADKGVATCLDALTGEERWRERLGGNYSSSPIFAAGRIYFSSEDGLTTVVQAGPTFDLVATNQLDGSIMASPAVVEGAMLMKTDTHLYRIEERKE